MEYSNLVISGISGRYPQSPDLETFWSNISAGIDVATIDDRRWPPNCMGTPARMAKMVNIDLFDNEFFNLTNKESDRIFCCIRLLHEVIYETFIDAGLSPDSWRGTKTGMFLGVSGSSEFSFVGADCFSERYSVQGLKRLSYCFDLTGPALEVDTACASSFSALDLAVLSIISGDCDQAIVAGHNLCFNPSISKAFKEMEMLNEEGKSKCLDASANGYLRCESVVALLIQRRSTAKRIYGSILSLETNCDGYTDEGITFPKFQVQCDLFRSLIEKISIDPLKINYVEAHVTGTRAGDPIECAAVLKTLRPNSDKPLLIGCVKSNIGHGEGSSSLNAISKVIKVFQTRSIPPNLHFKDPNRNIEGLVKGILKPVLTPTKFDDDLSLINSFGFGGVNCSMILKANSKINEQRDFDLCAAGTVRLVNFCNRTSEGLIDLVKFIEKQKGSLTKYTLALVDNLSKISPSKGFNHRGYLLLNDEQTIVHKTLKNNLSSEKMSTWFVFTPLFGVTSQTFKQLASLPLIYSRIESLNTKQLKSIGIDVITMIESNQQDITAFLLSSVAIQIALCDLLIKRLNIKPKGIIGHSIGLIAAAYADNCITDEEALLIGYHIGEACKKFKGQGVMAYINLPWEQIEKIKPDEIELALHESADWTMVTGMKDTIEKFILKLDHKVRAHIVDTKGIPFSSSLLSDIAQSAQSEIQNCINFTKLSTLLMPTFKITDEFKDQYERLVCAKYFTSVLTTSCYLHEIHEQLLSDSVSIVFGPSNSSDKRSIYLIDPIGLKEQLSQQKFTNLSLYKAIGEIYLNGLNPLIENLYDPIEYPVPRETQSISHLIKWKHDKKHFTPKYWRFNRDCYRLVKPIDISDPEWNFLNGHEIDGRILFPATGYYYTAWHLICDYYDTDPNDQPIEFHQLFIHHATTFTSSSSSFNFKLDIDEALESFSIFIEERTNPCVTGKYRLVDKPSIHYNGGNDYLDDGKHEEIVLKKKDIYKEFRTRGYEYSGSFQALEEASSKGTWGLVKDTGHWICFADACSQLPILEFRSRHLSVPVYINYIYMYPPETKKAFTERSSYFGTGQLKVINNMFTGIRYTNGFITQGQINELFRRKVSPNNLITTHDLIPFDSFHELSVEKRESLQIYISYCIKLMGILEDSNKLNDDELNPILEKLVDDNSSDTLLRILSESVRLGKMHLSEDQTGFFNLEFDNVMKKYSTDLINDQIFVKPLTKLFDKMFSIVENNFKSSSISTVLCNFMRTHFEFNTTQSLNYVSVIDSYDYAIEASLANKMIIDNDANIIHFNLDQDSRINKSKQYEFIIIRDKSTYLMYKDHDAERPCNQFNPLLKVAFNSLQEGGFCLILTRTKLTLIELEWQKLIGNNQEINFDRSTLESCADTAGFVWVCCKEMINEGYCSVLLRRPFAPNPEQIVSIIKVTLDKYDWVDKIKKAGQDKNHKIWLVGGGYNGLEGLTKCLLADPHRYNVRCYYDASKREDEEIVIPNDVLMKDLSINQVDYDGIAKHSISELIDIDETSIVTTSCYADVKLKGDLSSLRWLQSSHSKWNKIPEDKLKTVPDKVIVYYSALNFRDVLVASGRIPARSYPVHDLIRTEFPTGTEFAGKDKLGNRFMGICQFGGISTSMITDLSSPRIPVPDNWTLAEAATVPVVYFTAYYGLIIRGNLKSGESVLINAGSGGVGQAAISICLARGCEVFTTVGTQEKRDFIKKRFPSLDDNHIGDSRSTSFEEMIMKTTNGRGVDLVLNSLSDDKFAASVRCLADFGRFIEIGKHDMIQNTKMEPQSMDYNKTFHSCCLAFLHVDVTIKKIPERIKIWQNLVTLVTEGIKSGEVVPLPSTIFQMDQLEESFRFMATGKHIGKVLIQMRDETEDLNAVKLYPAISQTFFDLEKSYIITGGLGGLGLEVAYWMVQRGATNLILTSRSGIKTKYQEYLIDRIKNNDYTNTKVIISNEDCLTYESAERLVNQSQELGQIGGIFHLSMVLKDLLVENQTPGTFDEVVKPKAIACRYLDKLARSLPYDLDYFVCFSSFSIEIGVVGQVNYCYANGSVEQICAKRRLDGHHGLAIRWGPIDDVGIVSENEIEFSGHLAENYKLMKLSAVIYIFDKILCSPYWLYSAVTKSDKIKSLISSGESLKQTVLHILGIKDETKLDPGLTLLELGLDSLMTTELQQILEEYCGYSVPPDKLRGLKIFQLEEINSFLEPSFQHTDNFETLDGKTKQDLLIMPTQFFIPLNKVKYGSPYFYFPPAVGTFTQVLHIFASLPKQVIGVSWPPEIQHLETIDEIANFYVNLLTTHYPDLKDFNLIGYSFGGIIALEIAKLLQKFNQITCRNVILLDSSPEFTQTALLFQSEKFQSNYWPMVVGLLLYLKVASFEEIMDKLFSFDTDNERYGYVSGLISKSTGYSVTDKIVAEGIDNYVRKMELCRTFEAEGKFYGKICLIRSTKAFIVSSRDILAYPKVIPKDYGLAKHTTQSVEIHELPGNHLSFMDDNHGKVVSIIRNIMEQR